MSHLLPALAAAEPGSAHVQLHVLLTGVQTGGLALLADALELASIGLYLLAVRRLAHRGRRWSAPATASFVTGVVVLWIAIGSGLASYDDVNVQVHVVQHVLIMMVAAPLLALSKPVTLASQALGRGGQVRLLRLVHSRVVAVLTFPVLTWFLYFGVMYAFFGDRSIYDFSVSHPLFHDGSHLLCLVIGLLYWQPLLGTDPTRWRLAFPVRLLIVFVGMPFEAFLGISVNMSSQTIDPINTLAQTRAAGQTFWVLSMAATVVTIAKVALQWYHQMERQTPREDRQADLQAAQAQDRAAQLGVTPGREGWTVPAWRLAQIERQRSLARAAGQATPRAAPPGR